MILTSLPHGIRPVQLSLLLHAFDHFRNRYTGGMLLSDDIDANTEPLQGKYQVGQISSATSHPSSMGLFQLQLPEFSAKAQRKLVFDRGWPPRLGLSL